MNDKLQELLDWMFFNSSIVEATEIMSNQLAPVQRDAIIEKLEALKKKKEDYLYQKFFLMVLRMLMIQKILQKKELNLRN